MNRVKDDRYPNTICGVVEQEKFNKKSLGKRMVYFILLEIVVSLVGSVMVKVMTQKNLILMQEWYDISRDLVNDKMQIVDFTEGATHYHADYVFPEWRKTKTKTVEIADHIFYRWEK